jgi:PAS domain S-box-containing protein
MGSDELGLQVVLTAHALLLFAVLVLLLGAGGGGVRLGLGVTLLGVVASSVLFLEQRAVPLWARTDFWLHGGLLLLEGLGASAVGMMMRGARRRAEAEARAVRESEARYRRLVETATEGICRVDGMGRIEYVNARLEELLGSEAGALVGRGVTELVGEADRPVLTRCLERCRRDRSEQGEYRLRRADGVEFWVLMGTNSLRSEEGEYLGAVIMVTPIIAQKEAEALLEALFASVPVGLAFLDLSLRCVRINETLAGWRGLSAGAARGRAVHEVLPGLAGGLEPLLQQVLEGGEPVVEQEIAGEPACRAPRPGRHAQGAPEGGRSTRAAPRWRVSSYLVRPPGGGAVLGIGLVLAAADGAGGDGVMG